MKTAKISWRLGAASPPASGSFTPQTPVEFSFAKSWAATACNHSLLAQLFPFSTVSYDKRRLITVLSLLRLFVFLISRFLF